MTAKKYVLSFVSALYVLLALNLAMWHFCTRKFFTQRDLNRLGNFSTTPELTHNAEYKEFHTEFKDWLKSWKTEEFDVITIGDSFSQGGAGNYYQDYLADKFGLRVLNLQGDFYDLLSSGIINEFKPRTVIYEIVERGVQERLGSAEIRPKTNRIMQSTSREITGGFFEPVMFRINLQFLRNMTLRIVEPEKLSPQVYIAELDRNLFTNPGQENLLLHYHHDLGYLNTPLNAEMINRNLNNAAQILQPVRLIFFAGVDKYDLYYPYIKDKHGRPENNFFDEMRKVKPKNYVFIDTKAILREALERGEKDIYWLSDTHWTWKAQQLVGEEIAKYLIH